MNDVTNIIKIARLIRVGVSDSVYFDTLAFLIVSQSFARQPCFSSRRDIREQFSTDIRSTHIYLLTRVDILETDQKLQKHVKRIRMNCTF